MGHCLSIISPLQHFPISSNNIWKLAVWRLGNGLHFWVMTHSEDSSIKPKRCYDSKFTIGGQCCGFVTCWHGYCHFRHWPSRHEQKKFLSFSAYNILKVHLHHFSQIKSHKEVKWKISRNQGFSYYFRLIIGLSGLLINGSGSRGPKTYGSYGSGSATQ